MAKVTFTARIYTAVDGTPVCRVPSMSYCHCDRMSFLSHPRFGAYVNSNLFLKLVGRHLRELLGLGSDRVLNLNELPEAAEILKSNELFVTVLVIV